MRAEARFRLKALVPVGLPFVGCGLAKVRDGALTATAATLPTSCNSAGAAEATGNPNVDRVPVVGSSFTDRGAALART